MVPRRLRSLAVILGPPLLLKLALITLLVPWLQDWGRQSRMFENERLLLSGDQLLKGSLERPLAPALVLARKKRLERLQQQLADGTFHGCYQQSSQELSHLVGWMLATNVSPADQPRRFGRQVAVFRRNLDACRRSDDGRV